MPINSVNCQSPPNPMAVKSTIKKTIRNIHEYSKCGFSGYGVKKVNQDISIVFKNFGSVANHYFMSVW